MEGSILVDANVRAACKVPSGRSVRALEGGRRRAIGPTAQANGGRNRKGVRQYRAYALVSRGVCSGKGQAKKASNSSELEDAYRSIHSVQQDGGGRRRAKAPKGCAEGRLRARMRPFAARCVGCDPEARPGGSEALFALNGRSGNRHRGTRRRGAAAALERTALRSALREAVPGDVRAGFAGAPARVPRAMRAAVPDRGPGQVRRDRRGGRCTHAQHGAAARDADAERERGAKRARGCGGRVPDVRTRKRAAPPPERRGGPRCAAVRPRRAGRGCRAAAPCRRGSR